MKREIFVNVDELVDCLECVQDANKDDLTIVEAINEAIDIVYDLSREVQNGRFKKIRSYS